MIRDQRGESRRWDWGLESGAEIGELKVLAEIGGLECGAGTGGGWIGAEIEQLKSGGMESREPRSGTKTGGTTATGCPPPLPHATHLSPFHALRTSSPHAFIAAGTAGTPTPPPRTMQGHPAAKPPSHAPCVPSCAGGDTQQQVTVPSAPSMAASRLQGLEQRASPGWVVLERWG